MNLTDAYYRALLAYRAETAVRRDHLRDRGIFTASDADEEIKLIRAECTVDEEWINEIEKGLVYIEKAIKEERQFIYSNGEVVPIEKVKNVSRESVEHLARHSNLITKKHEGDDLIPDQLYTVERYSDYTVYENRFLYMLLCYLRDFVTLRYQRILDLTNRYDGALKIKKNIHLAGRTFNIDLNMHDIRKDDPYLRKNNPAKDLIDRMDLILKGILAYLATPLMESVEKAPMLKPPITKTNVIKMNNNFKAAYALYEYIVSYDGDGYEVKEKIKTISPFHDNLGEDMAEAELLISYLTYSYNLELQNELKATYEAEEAAKRREELRKKTAQMESVRRRLESEGKPQEEYILYLEKHLRSLQNEADKLPSLYAEIDSLRNTVMSLNEKAETQQEEIKTLHKAAEDEKIAHEEEIEKLKYDHREEIENLSNSHREEINTINENHAEEILSISNSHREELNSIAERHANEINELNDIHRQRLSELNEQNDEIRGALAEKEKEYRNISDENDILKARILSVRAKHGDISESEKDSMTEQESFEELEKQLEQFVKFYKDQWSLTKRKIRKDLLNMKYIKEQSDKK